MQGGNNLITGGFANSWCAYGLPLPEGALILPLPDSDSLYYLFHEEVSGWLSGMAYPTELLVTIVDMSLDNGLGGVISKSAVVLNDTLIFGELQAVKHANGRDWWVMVHEYNTSLFYKYLLLPQGLTGPDTQSIGSNFYAHSQVAFSPDGNWYARYSPYDDLDIFQFDRCTGQFTYHLHIAINDSQVGGGIAFSPNSSVLYASSQNYLYQFDLTNPNIASTQTTVAVYDGFVSPFPTYFFLAQLAQDGKIYLNCSNGTDIMHVINNPDVLGLGCNVVQHGIQLPTYNAFTILNAPNYFLGVVSGSICDSLTGINETSYFDFSFSVYPNPVKNDFLSVIYLLPQNKGGTFEIFEMNGRKVYSTPLSAWSTLHRVKINLEEGIYFAKVSVERNRAVKRFVVME
jgi:hypothetical protein